MAASKGRWRSRGKGFLVQDADERQKAHELLSKRAPVSGGQDAPAYVRVVPQRIEVRTTGETAEGAPATVLEFPENRLVASDWSLLKRKALAWLLAVRAPFLTATVAPVVLGGAVAWATRDSLNWGLLFLDPGGGGLPPLRGQRLQRLLRPPQRRRRRSTSTSCARLAAAAASSRWGFSPRWRC